MLKTKIAAAIFTVVSLASAASAAVVQETFNLYDEATYTYGASYNSMTFTGSLGTTVTVTAQYYDKYPNETLGATNVQYWGGYGLGAGTESPSPWHAVDGDNGNEVLFFDFGMTVTLTNIEFYDAYYSAYGNRSEFDLYANDGNGTNMDQTVFTNTDVSGLNRTGSIFGIGAYWSTSAFKVDGLTISYHVGEVPVPASGLLILVGMGGLAAMRRRKV